ncbi:hypothetical protein IWW57_000558, partial [Coemansia sp. S610]
MPPKTDNKKKARDDALQFLETLEINDDEDTANSLPAETTASSAEVTNADDGGGDEKKDPKSMLKFIDDLTESAKRSA